MSKLDELNELLASVAPKPKPLPKPKIEALKDKLASPPDRDRSREVLAQSQAQFHQEELRRLKPNEKLLRNKRLFGRTSGPLPPDEQRLLNLQISTHQAMEASMDRERADREHRAQLNEFLKLY